MRLTQLVLMKQLLSSVVATSSPASDGWVNLDHSAWLLWHLAVVAAGTLTVQCEKKNQATGTPPGTTLGIYSQELYSGDVVLLAFAVCRLTK